MNTPVSKSMAAPQTVPVLEAALETRAASATQETAPAIDIALALEPAPVAIEAAPAPDTAPATPAAPETASALEMVFEIAPTTPAPETAPVTVVLSDEVIYRRVENKPEQWKVADTGEVFVTSSAFFDKKCQPSVDRALMCQATQTQQHPDNGVVCLRVGEVREIHEVFRNDPKGRPLVSYSVDVHHRPEPNNDAHAQVETTPDIPLRPTDVFRRLRHALAKLATDWKILPQAVRARQQIE